MIEDYIQQLHDDVYGVLSGDPGFFFVPVFRTRTPLEKDEAGAPIVGQSTMIEDKIHAALSGIEEKNGKCGIVAIVMLPDVEPQSENSIGPSLKLMPRVRIIENRLINEGPTGTGIAASRLALHTVQVLHRRSLRGMGTLSAHPRKMIEEISLPDDQMAHEVLLVCDQSVPSPVKVQRPQISQAGGQITLSTSTPDASLYYTLNETWPGVTSEQAVLYSEPFQLAAGTHQLRVAAYTDDGTPSDDVWAEIIVIP